MQTHSQYSYFKVSEAWAILSDIEQSIKQKVEIVGTPLKDWDVEKSIVGFLRDIMMLL